MRQCEGFICLAARKPNWRSSCLLQAQVLTPFIDSLRHRQADAQLYAAISSQMSSLHAFFKRLNEADKSEIRCGQAAPSPACRPPPLPPSPPPFPRWRPVHICMCRHMLFVHCERRRLKDTLQQKGMQVQQLSAENAGLVQRQAEVARSQREQQQVPAGGGADSAEGPPAKARAAPSGHGASSSAAGRAAQQGPRKATNVMFLPYHLHPSQNLWR